ncbi:acyltransferase family protein [Kineosporia succinea]|uniref:Peptidoglycan/LPS O-acetylase OafA/YrhL n=1 Tax=Kineosporia succinea TaxID=84632 RepID=A0ABT9NWP8_9ACTN|nr:acyltransferase [Kineosporia succinea]MDP9824844.1 peptidoglycan/LPS O-acetylase OafA/YrhL [Kineosporia succinea]
MPASDISSDDFDRTQPPIPEAPLETGVTARPLGGGQQGTTPAPAIPRRFTALDGLRGLAALAVIFFHLRRELRDVGMPDHLDRLVTGGYLMVDLFFVLSGFVLARTMLRTRGAGEALRFSELRIRRFMPLHLTGWVVALAGVVVLAVCQQFDLLHTPERGAFDSEDTGPIAWASSFVLLQGLFGPQFAGYPAAWSLSVELWSNILIVAVIALMPGASYRRLVGPAAVLAGAVLLAWTPPAAENSVGAAAFGRGLAGLGAGMVAYELFLMLMRRRSRHDRASSGVGVGAGAPGWAVPVSVIALGLLVLAVWEREVVRELRFLPMLVVAPLLVLSLALPGGGPVKWVLDRPVSQWLGSRSFALYALHGPVLMTVELLLELRGFETGGAKVSAFVIIATVSGSLIAAELGHRYVETAWLPRRKSAAAAPARESVSV